MAPLRASIPNIRIAKPIRIEPMFFFLSRFESMNKNPTKASIGVKDDGFKSRRKKFSPEIPLRLKIHAVTVVPMFAPIIILIVWESFIIPEFTKPTSITVVAEEL